MNDWIPAVTTSSLLGVLGWLASNLVSTRLKATVEHEFNAKLAQLQGQLDARTAEIEAMRNGVLSAMSGRQTAFDKRRLEAVDQIWAAATSLSVARFTVTMLTILKADELASLLRAGDAKVRGFINSLPAAPSMDQIDSASAAKARPFVTPMVWATYSALSTVCGHAITSWIVLKGGLTSKQFVDEERLKNLVKLALPHRAEYIDQHGAIAAYHLLNELEEQLIVEIQRMLEGVDDDRQRVRRAADIVSLTRQLQEEDSKARIPGVE